MLQLRLQFFYKHLYIKSLDKMLRQCYNYLKNFYQGELDMKNRLICAAVAVILAVTALSSVLSVSATDNGYKWVGSWSTSPVQTGITIAGVRMCDFLNNCSYRTVIQMTVGGTKIRLKYSNLYGDNDVVIDETNIARTSVSSDADIIKNSVIPVTFKGKRSVTIPAGKEVYCDAIDMTVSALEHISITSYVKDFQYFKTAGFYGGITYMEFGNRLEQDSFTSMSPLDFSAGAITYHQIPFLCEADVWCPADYYSAVFIGDSTITNQSPYYLAERLQRSGVRNVGICQQAIIANKLLNDGDGNSVVGNIYGKSMLKRFDHDALQTAAVKKIFVKIGVNDVIHPRCKSMADKVPLVTADQIIKGYKTVISEAHKAGCEIYFFSRTAWKGYDRNFGLTASREPDVVWSQEAEDILLALNRWLKYEADIDGYIDLDFLRDPSDPTKLTAEYTSDGAHLTELGSRLLADAVPGEIFGVPNSSLISVNSLYLSGRGGEKVTTPFTPVTTTKVPDTTKKQTPDNADTPKTESSITTSAQSAPSSRVETFIATVTEMHIDSVIDLTEYATVLTPVNPTVPVPASETVTQATAPEPVKELDAGTVTGIVIVAVLLIGAASFLTVFFVNKKKMTD